MRIRGPSMGKGITAIRAHMPTRGRLRIKHITLPIYMLAITATRNRAVVGKGEGREVKMVNTSLSRWPARKEALSTAFETRNSFPWPFVSFSSMRAISIATSEHSVENFSGGSPWHLFLFYEVNGLGPLVSGDLTPRKIDYTLRQGLSGLVSPVEHHKSLECLSPFFVRYADDRDILYRLVKPEHALHFRGIDVLAAGNNHVSFPVNQRVVTFLITFCQIPGRKPVSFKGFFCPFRIFEIFFKDAGRSVK